MCIDMAQRCVQRYMCLDMCTGTSAVIQACAEPCPYEYAQRHVHKQVYTHVHTHAHRQMCQEVCMHEYGHVCLHGIHVWNDTHGIPVVAFRRACVGCLMPGRHASSRVTTTLSSNLKTCMSSSTSRVWYKHLHMGRDTCRHSQHAYKCTHTHVYT